jgi:CRISPR-associated protein Cmr6
VYETGITLHHVYGIPYIPASSIKGVLRSWVIYSKFENSEKKALKDRLFCRVFGCPAESILESAHQGKVTFFDALPIKSPIIEPDIMNPHFPQWYGGKGAPVDTDKPNPVFFLTVKNTPFQFLLGSKEWNLESALFWDEKTLGWWLENALAEHGIGAKTAVGYGYMKPQSD